MNRDKQGNRIATQNDELWVVMLNPQYGKVNIMTVTAASADEAKEQFIEWFPETFGEPFPAGWENSPAFSAVEANSFSVSLYKNF